MKNFIFACLAAAALMSLTACTTPDDGHSRTFHDHGPQPMDNLGNGWHN
jgi:outer membrane protein assembly factor BamE (lipoprotein component of BamABCDE complex)